MKTDSACKICNHAVGPTFSAQILHKFQVKYYRCSECGFLQTEEPYWLDEAYTDAIALADTGIAMRNFSLATKLTSLLYLRFSHRGTYLDIAGGYGMLVRLMRDNGFDYYWEDKYCQNLLARGFEVDKSTNSFTALTAFEVLEHVHDPLVFIQEAMRRHNCRTLIFTTELYDGDAAPMLDWWYYSFATGQHISFYQRKTLLKIAEKLNLSFFSMNGIHIFTHQKIQPTLWLRLATGRLLSLVIAFWARRKIGSRTLSDHYMHMGKIKPTAEN